MADPTAVDAVNGVMNSINRAWLDGRPADLGSHLHEDMTTVVPGFDGASRGRDAAIAGFVDFCTSATVHEYGEGGRRIDVVGDTAVASFQYEMVYERSGGKYRASGRDLWVFARCNGEWLAVWRTMLDMSERDA
jgi:hypothetical protein